MAEIGTPLTEDELHEVADTIDTLSQMNATFQLVEFTTSSGRARVTVESDDSCVLRMTGVS